MRIEELKSAPQKPGIYYFKNTKNGKYYIGQAQEIRYRLMKHMNNFENNYYKDAHLYRAWHKWGIDVFEVGVLEIIDLPTGEERNKKLDELEENYIKQFNSYGSIGYNQTLGGDGGIKGYKFNDIQRVRQRINSLQTSLDGRYKIYFYDTKTSQYGECPSFKIISDIFNSNNKYIESHICYFGRYIFSKTVEGIERKKNIFYSKEYRYTMKDYIDNKTVCLQTRIDRKVEEYQREINDFFEEYGHAKYNRKDNKAKKDAIRKQQKEDLINGISKKDYKEKYDIKYDSTFYEHVRKMYPDWEPFDREYKVVPMFHMTEEMKEDILSGISCSDFMKKYETSDISYYRFKWKIEDEYKIKIKVEKYKKLGSSLSDEQERNILSNISCLDYIKKYNVSEDTYYSHRKIMKKKYPEHVFDKTNVYKPKIDIELIKDDIINGMSRRDFCLKYNLSESSYKKYKRLLLNEERIIPANVTKEMQADIRNGMKVDDYMKKYKVSNSTYYSHRSMILKPEEITKRHITLEDVISDEQRNDLLNGMNVIDYMIKYKCTNDTYYKHRKYVIPNEAERLKSRYDYVGKDVCKGLTEEQKQDLINGMSETEYIIKYKVSHRTYMKYRKLIKESEER